MTKVAVILSGCGHLDGSEIREAVLTLLYLDQHEAQVQIFAPNLMQQHAVNHVTGQEESQNRNIMNEAARIARGKIASITTLDPKQFDALILPGGYGVAKNLSDYAKRGKDCEVNPELSRIVRAFHEVRKPIGAICIAPVIIARILYQSEATLTIGEDPATAAVITALGCKHQVAKSHEVVVDNRHRIATCSAYMREDRLSNIARGIEALVGKVMDMAN